MLTSKEKQLIKQTKAENRLKRLRKQSLAARKKAISQYQLHRFKGADTSLLTRALENQASAKKQYTNTLKTLDTDREFNYYIYTLNRLSKKSFTTYTKRRYKWAAGSAAHAAKYPKRFHHLAVSRYRRHLRTIGQLPENSFPFSTAESAAPRGRGRRLGSFRRAGIKIFASRLLVRKAAIELRNTALPGPTRRGSFGQTESELFDEQLASATVRGQAGQLLHSIAPAITPLSALESTNLPRAPLRYRQERKRTYAVVKRQLVAFARRLAAYRKVSAKFRRAKKSNTLLQRYLYRRSTLRRRFFSYKLWTTKLTTANVVALPKLSAGQKYIAQRLTRIRAQRAFQRLGATSLLGVTGLLHESISNKQLTLKGGVLHRALRGRVRYVPCIPVTKRLVSWRVKTNLTNTKNSVLSSLDAYRPTRKSALRALQLRPPARRQRRAAAKSARLRRNISKGQQKRLRLGRVHREVKVKGYPTVQFATKVGATIPWKQRPSPAQRRSIHEQLGTITAAVATYSNLKTKYTLPAGTAIYSTKVEAVSRIRRATLWAFFSAVREYYQLPGADAKKRALIEPLIRKLRRTLRRGDSAVVRGGTPLFLFLLNALKVSAPSVRKVLYMQFKRWLGAGCRSLYITPRKQTARFTSNDLSKVSKLLHLLPRRRRAGRYTRRTTKAYRLVTTFRAIDRMRRKLHAALCFTTPRPVLAALPLPAAAPSAAVKLASTEVNPFIRKSSSSTGTEVLCQLPYLTRRSTITAIPSTIVAPRTAVNYTAAHTAVTLTPRTSRKKHLLPRLKQRKLRFPKFVPRWVKGRLNRERALNSNRRAVMGPRMPIMRYLRHAFPKGNRIFISRYNHMHRITGRRLVKQKRWSRATLLRLSRQRPVWRHAPRGRQIKATTGRVTTHAPYVVSGRGWRVRKDRAKKRDNFRKYTERFKPLFQAVNALLPSVELRAQSGVPVRVLRLATRAYDSTLTVKNLTKVCAEPLDIPAFYKAQQQLLDLRGVRTAHATARFNGIVRRVAGGLYRRRGGRFLLLNARKRKHPRKPRWIRLISKSATQALQFAAKQSPKLISTFVEKSVLASSSAPKLRKQLWTGIGRYYTVRKKGTKGRTPVKKTHSLVSATAPRLLEQIRYAKKMRRLSLLKKLLRGNKFNKLARLGQLNALGEYTYLADLGKLFELGSFTNELKQQILLKLAVDIKVCASLCAQGALQHDQLYAATTHASRRAFFVYKKLPVVFGRDATFFQSDAPKVKVLHRQVLRKKALLRVLNNVKPSPERIVAKQDNIALIRTVRIARVTAAKRLQRYRRVLPLKERVKALSKQDKLKRKEPSLRLSSRAWARINHFESLWSRKKLTKKRIKRSLRYRKPAYRLSSPRKHSVKCSKCPAVYTRAVARLVNLNKLPKEYRGAVRTVISQKLWVGHYDAWARKTLSTPLRAETLPKSFSAAHPWGVKILYSGGVATDYSRFEAGITKAIVALRGPKGLTKPRPRANLVRQLTAFRLSTFNTVRAQSLPRILHAPANDAGRKFWQLRCPGREQIKAQAEQRLQALSRLVGAKKILKRVAPPRIEQISKVTKVKAVAKKTAPAVVNQKSLFTTYYIKKLGINVFDTAVHSNLQRFVDLPPTEQENPQGYDFIKRAYRAALSSQEKNSKLPQLQFDSQKAHLSALLEKYAGVPPINGKALEWKQLPKNQSAPRYATVSAVAQAGTTGIQVKTPVTDTRELTPAEINSIRDEETKKNLKKFISTPLKNRRTNGAYLYVKKAVLHSWTKVEDANTPEESPYYRDLLLSAKAYSFYSVTLDLTSKAATVTTIAQSFAKLPK